MYLYGMSRWAQLSPGSNGAESSMHDVSLLS